MSRNAAFDRSVREPISDGPSIPPSSLRASNQGGHVPSSTASQSDDAREPERKAAYQKFVLADPVAFRYLEEDPSTRVIARRSKLVGYECYVVEQWACSRAHPTFVITAYSGDTTHSIIVNVLEVSTDEASWSPRLKVYFKALNQYHARRRETPLGTLMTTNLSGFPSSLTVIRVPDGDVKSVRQDFVVNEDLKRLGCSGRVGLTFSKPNVATKNKFYQLYRTNTDIAFYEAVVQLVKLCQIALMLFDKLQPEYVDGLLCDVTEKAINDWWVEFGTEYYNVEPHDGILGPTTVAALLGMLTGARNRLNTFGAPVSKDVFDIDTTKRAIAYFQKAQHIRRTRRLDRHTMSRLHRATAKAANSDGAWLVPRAVKSTVADISGRGGEMVRDIVGRDKVNTKIGEVETTDIEHFVDQIHGQTSKWLWQGKKRKGSFDNDMFGKASGGRQDMVFQDDQHGGYEWSRQRKGPFLVPSPEFGDEPEERQNQRSSLDLEERERNRLVKRPTRQSSHRDHDGGRGLGRIKDVVGLRSHHQRVLRDEQRSRNVSAESDLPESTSLPHDIDQFDAAAGVPSLQRTDTMKGLTRNETFKTAIEGPDRDRNFSALQHQQYSMSSPALDSASDNEQQQFLSPFVHEAPRSWASGTASRSRSPTASIAGSRIDLPSLAADIDTIDDEKPGTSLRRTRSFSRYEQRLAAPLNEARFPRRISFSIAEESVLIWTPLITADEAEDSIDIHALPRNDTRALQILQATLQAHSAHSHLTSDTLTAMETQIGDWLTTQLASLTTLNTTLDAQSNQLSTLLLPHQQTFTQLSHTSQSLLQNEREGLDAALREIEVLGAKLEYEINVLRGRVEDTEEGVLEFERQVEFVEDRVREVESQLRPKENWVHWGVRLVTGIGSKPRARVKYYGDEARRRESMSLRTLEPVGGE